jgi:rhodanese-related sulfurtransferase
MRQSVWLIRLFNIPTAHCGVGFAEQSLWRAASASAARLCVLFVTFKNKIMPITKGYRALVDEAMAEVLTHSVEQIRARLGTPGVQLVDIRDIRELEREGTIPGAIHAPRGMLEFWVDPESPYFRPELGHADQEYVLFCGAGWRSALSAQTLMRMGLHNVSHMDGGFGAWVQAHGPVETLAERKARRQRPA